MLVSDFLKFHLSSNVLCFVLFCTPWFASTSVDQFCLYAFLLSKMYKCKYKSMSIIFSSVIHKVFSFAGLAFQSGILQTCQFIADKTLAFVLYKKVRSSRFFQ